jgi:hypothetical protein
MTKQLPLLALLLVGFTSGLFGQTDVSVKQLEAQVEVTYANYLGQTKPLRELIPLSATSDAKRKERKRDRMVPENFFGRGKRKAPLPNALPQGADPVRQAMTRSDMELVVEPLVNIPGISRNGGSPHDPSGDVGRDYYMQAVNATTLAVYDKTGQLVASEFAANTIWSSIGFSSAGDPIIMYDQEAERWLITEFPFGNQLLVAVSDSSDPLGTWKAYNFGTPNFPDYPKYGVWNNSYAVTTNEQGPSVLPAYFIDREALLAGEEEVMIQRLQLPGTSGGPGFFVGTPVDWSGFTPPTDGPMILSLNDDAWGSSEDRIEIFTVDLDWNDPSNTAVEQTSVPTAPYDSNPCSVPGFGFSCVPQGGNGGGLDGLPEIIMNQPHYRNFGTYESLVLTFLVDATAGGDLSAMRWMEMRRTPGAEWTVYQEGTYAPDDGLDRYAGTIAMDGSGNIGLAYAVSSEEEFVGIRFTGRRASDPLGVMTVQEYEIVGGTNTIQSNARFGDYFHMSVDPVNERTFWFTGEYGGGGSGRSATRIAAFEIRRDTIDLAPTSLLTPENSADLGMSETVAVEVTNVGLDTVTSFSLGFLFEDTLVDVDTVSVVLPPDSTYQHAFDNTVDMSQIGSYAFKVFTDMVGDSAVFNDTLRTVVSKLSRFDAGISNIEGLDNVSCQDSVAVNVVLTNFGTELLESVEVTLELNGVVVATLEYTEGLAAGTSVGLMFILDGYVNGSNTIEAYTQNPNGIPDQVPTNDAFGRDFDALVDGVTFTLELLTDDYPEETTWELTDEDGDVIYAGGPYNEGATLFTESFCLDSTQCYTFTIFDAVGDGICCGFGEGNYSILNGFGEAVVNSTGEFGNSESTDFCATFDCMLGADIDVAPATMPGIADGVIFINPLNGVGPYQYSIDGGQSFQESNIFTGLPEGTYEVVITGSFNCAYEATITVVACDLQLSVAVIDESEAGAGDGSLLISVGNANAPISYSIDGGVTFQQDSVFTGLDSSTYLIVVQDSLGCVDSTSTLLTDIVDAPVYGGIRTKVFPNPTDGLFRIEVYGLEQSSPFLGLQIYDATGRKVQESSLTRYDERFTGMLSLVAYPAGMYYVRFESVEAQRLLKVVKN